jgi:type I restriction enzyme S subunit
MMNKKDKALSTQDSSHSIHTPAIRFKRFGGEWSNEKLGGIVDFLDEQRKPIESGARDPGPYPYYGASGIIDYVKDFLFDEELILLSEDGANIIDRNYRVCFLVSGKYWVNNHAHVLKGKRGYRNGFICEALERLNYEQYNTGTAQPKLNQDVCRNIDLMIPLFPEQTKIGDYFQQLDTLIAQYQQKHDKLLNLKKSLLEKMFPRAKANDELGMMNAESGSKNNSSLSTHNSSFNTPEIRFKGFSRAWEETALGDEMDVTSVKRIHQSDWSGSGIRFLRARDVVSAYKNEEPSEHLYITEEIYTEYSLLSGKVKKGDLLVTGVGTIGIPLLILDDNPVYFKDGNIIWFKNENKIDGLFLYNSFINQSIQTYIKHSAGTGTVGTYTIDSGKKTPLSIPESAEQIKIGNLFKQLDTLINQHQSQLKKLGNIKQACLAKMFA